jgi:hypothetical protein
MSLTCRGNPTFLSFIIERAHANISFQKLFKRMHKYKQTTYYFKYLKLIIE